ncbi:HET-domain-containing protein [Rostrohypoxylon terebratum]|nr:HET-domain-containing protein [Rostrohypoxylon terebratum]
MRLLDAHSRKLKLVNFEGREIPKYVILSHTWEKEGEVTFEDVSKNDYEHKSGYSKIEGCRQLAIRHKCDWFWIDTCCIDKSSSAELSEAINSMYAWYQRARFCFVYLADVPRVPFSESRWHTRGWTLQELLAPPWVYFYDATWKKIGSRDSMMNLISEITGISVDIIEDNYKIKRANTALKLSWVSRRETSREEDMAYCLMGLLDVNMPLLYGEGGTKAFHRLQKELMKEHYDHTIFAWKLESRSPERQWYKRTLIPFLAPSPAAFSKWDASINTIPPKGTHYVSTNLGLLISLPIIFLSDGIGLGLLDCEHETTQNRIALPLFIQTRLDGLHFGTKCCDISPFAVPESATKIALFAKIYLQDTRSSFFQELSVRWSALSINDYELADYYPPNNRNRISSMAGNFKFYGDFLLRFRHEYLDDILIMGRRGDNRDTHSPIKNDIQVFSGYAAITSVSSNIRKQEGQQRSRPLSSWELLLQPNFDKVDFDQLEESFQWSSSMDVVMNHLEGSNMDCARRVRFRLKRTELKYNREALTIVSTPILETMPGDYPSKPSS